MPEHVLETLSVLEMYPELRQRFPDAEVLIDCSCGAEIPSDESESAIEAAFIGHVPGDWKFARDPRDGHLFTDNYLVAAPSET